MSHAEPNLSSTLSIVDGAPHLLSLTALHSELTTRGVEIPYSSLSQFVALGDIAEQLGVGGKGNRREFPRWSADFLADFLPWYQASKINKDLAADAVRHRMSQFSSSQKFITRSGATDMELYEQSSLPPPFPPLPVVLEQLADAIINATSNANVGRRGPLPDRLLNAEEAAYLLGCKPGTVSKRVQPVLRGRYRESDVFAFIASLGTATTATGTENLGSRQ